MVAEGSRAEALQRDWAPVRCRAHHHGLAALTTTADPSELTPIMNDLAVFFDASLAPISGHGELAKTIRYARSRWIALTRYLDDGTLEMSNNAAERAIRRPFGRGFAGAAPQLLLRHHGDGLDLEQRVVAREL